MLKLTCFFVMGTVLVSAFEAIEVETLTLKEYQAPVVDPDDYAPNPNEPVNPNDDSVPFGLQPEGLRGCHETEGCRDITEEDCLALGNVLAQWNPEEMYCDYYNKNYTSRSNWDEHLCICNVHFVQPTSPDRADERDDYVWCDEAVDAITDGEPMPDVLGVILRSPAPGLEAMEFSTLEQCKEACDNEPGCNGVTLQDDQTLGCVLRAGATTVMATNLTGRTSAVKRCDAADADAAGAAASNPNDAYGGAYGGAYYYDGGAGGGEPGPCGYYEMLKWNEYWDLPENTEAYRNPDELIPMHPRSALNSEYHDCIDRGGLWRDVIGENDWMDYSGPRYCRVWYEYFTWEGPKPEPVDSFLCKRTCKQGHKDCELPDSRRPVCTCDGGTAEDNWLNCFFDGNHQCTSCDNPSHTLIANRYTNEVTCEETPPYHLVECGRDYNWRMRIVPQAVVAPYSRDMCAYWVKQDPLCEGDYFATFNHLNQTDFTEENWETFKKVQMEHYQYKQDPSYDWEGEKKTFLEEWEMDIRSTGVRQSYFMRHRQKMYGCSCRPNQTHPDFNNAEANLTGPWDEQMETWNGWMGNFYKFEDAANGLLDDHKTYGPRFLNADPEATNDCAYPNYKITGLLGYWGCSEMPLWGWILAPTTGSKPIASPKYYRAMANVGDVVNLQNGKYSFLCYAAKGKYKLFMNEPHKMTSWTQGHSSIGFGKYNHSAKMGVCATLKGAHMFKRNYTIDIPEVDKPPEMIGVPVTDTEMVFTIQNWDFKDGRMTYLGDEPVDDDYEPKEDPRWEPFKSKFTQFTRKYMWFAIEYDFGNMAANEHFKSAHGDCSDETDILNFKRAMDEYLLDHKWKYGKLPDDTRNGTGVYVPKPDWQGRLIPFDPDYQTNVQLAMEWYFDTMMGSSERALHVRCLGITCKRLAFPDVNITDDPLCANMTNVTAMAAAGTGSEVLDSMFGGRKFTMNGRDAETKSGTWAWPWQGSSQESDSDSDPTDELPQRA